MSVCVRVQRRAYEPPRACELCLLCIVCVPVTPRVCLRVVSDVCVHARVCPCVCLRV